MIQCIAKRIKFLSKRQSSTVPSSFVSAERVKMPNKTSELHISSGQMSTTDFSNLFHLQNQQAVAGHLSAISEPET